MDFDKLTEKVSKWLSDPGAREVIKSLIYVLLPLIVFSLVRSIKRPRAAKKDDTAITPRIRGSNSENLISTETLRETMAREKKKVARELQEVFGRRERSLARPRGGGAFPSEVPAEEPMRESPGPGDDQATGEDLMRVPTAPFFLDCLRKKTCVRLERFLHCWIMVIERRGCT
jgi:hypothetical protein